MTTHKHKQMTDWVLELSGRVNPYSRQLLNQKNEFYLYQMGFIASVLASLMEEDPALARQYKRHINSILKSQGKRTID